MIGWRTLGGTWTARAELPNTHNCQCYPLGRGWPCICAPRCSIGPGIPSCRLQRMERSFGTGACERVPSASPASRKGLSVLLAMRGPPDDM